MRRIFGLLALLVACGASSSNVVQLPPAPSASAASVGASTTTANACATWKACRVVGEPVRVSEARIGQSPNVVWDGNEALVVYETPREGTHLAAVAGGHVLWTELVAGMNPEIAWNARTRTGLVVTSETIAWLGRDGKPVHKTKAPQVTNLTFHGGVAASKDGFIVATGVGSHASSAPPVAFSIARVGALADTLDWKRVDDDGLRYAPLVAKDAIISQPFKSAPQLFMFSSSDEPGTPVTMSSGAAMRAVAFDPPYIVYVEETTHALSLTMLNTTPVDLGVRSTRSGSAVLLHVGDKLILGADKIGDSAGVALAPLDANAGHVGAPLAIGPEKSQHLRAAANDEGFVAVWNIADDGAPMVQLMSNNAMHGLSTMLAVYACCPAP